MRFYLDQHGCAKNQVDGEEIIVRLEDAGHVEVGTAAEADLIIVNSCGFIESAKKESIDAVLGYRGSLPGKRILLAGCMAQRYAKELALELPEADGIVGNADLSAVVLAAADLEAGGRPVIVPEAAASIGTVRRRRLLDWPGTAHVKITEGCSNNCTFCAIPLIRGRLRSRGLSEIVAEIADFVARGTREIVLVGQDLGSFGRDLAPPVAGPGRQLLPELLSAISALDGDFRIRVMYVHPDNFPLAILPLMQADRRLLPYFDLPFQHASPSILARMNRRGNQDKYLDLLATIRSALPDAMLRSTFLLGFPGETDADFEVLRDFQEKARLDWLGSFAYSREEGTGAAGMKGKVAARTVASRRAAIEEAQERITHERLQRFIGRELEVLVEEPLEEEDGGYSIGRAWMQAPEVDGLTVIRGVFAPGAMLKVRVLAVAGVDLDAEALDAGSPVPASSGQAFAASGRASKAP
jgi:ribosomal protein S12 methylthiotransferase